MSDNGQISFPVRVIDGQLATVDVTSDRFVLEQAQVLCVTPLGWVPGLPDMGLADQKFRMGGADIGAIETQIERWVPGVDAAVTRDPRLLERALDEIGVQVAR